MHSLQLILLSGGLMLMIASGSRRPSHKPSPKVDAWCPSAWHPSVLCSRHGDCNTKPWAPHPANLSTKDQHNFRRRGKAMAADGGGSSGRGGRHSCFLPSSQDGSGSFGSAPWQHITFVSALYDIKRGSHGRGMSHYTDWLLKTLSINANIILYTSRGEMF